MSNVVFTLLFLYFAVSVGYWAAMALNTKFNWWSTHRRIIKIDTPAAKEFKDLSNRMYVQNLLIIALTVIVCSVMVGLLFVIFSMKSYKLAVLEHRIPKYSPVADVIKVSSRFGERMHPLYNQELFHNGLDFKAGYGETIRATGDGVVVANDYNTAAGNYIVVSHGKINNKELVTKYFHLGRHNFVHEGDLVKAGQKIAEVGNTGMIAGIHAHYEVLWGGANFNPAKFVRNFNPKAYDAFVSSTLGTVPSQHIAQVEKVAIKQRG